MAFIFVTLLIDVIGFGLIIPVLPNLVSKLAGGGEQHSSLIYGLLLSTYGLMQFIFAPILGNLSDRYGRRPVLLLSLLATGIDYVVQALAPSLGWLFFGRIVAGITGASFTAATAYIADVSPPEKRAQNFGMVGAAFGLGFVLGPALGGFLGGISIRLPFWAAAGVTILNLLYGYFVLPESLDKENRRPFTLSSANPFKGLAILGRHTWVLWLTLATGLLWIAQQVPPSTMVLYTNYRFHWNEQKNGYALAILGLATMGVQMGLIRIMSKRMSDLKMLAFSMAMNVVGFVAMGSAPTGKWMVGAMVLWTVSFVGGPALQSLVSRQYGPTEQGGVQGALTSLQSLTGVIGPLLLTAIFGHFTAAHRAVKIPGAAFFTGAVLTALAALLVFYGRRFRTSAPDPIVADV